MTLSTLIISMFIHPTPAILHDEGHIQQLITAECPLWFPSSL